VLGCFVRCVEGSFFLLWCCLGESLSRVSKILSGIIYLEVNLGGIGRVLDMIDVEALRRVAR
jgi:hypothetical protein